ncbi:MAG: PASTA domain-containing protein [Flavobacteriales bacterium]
MKSIQFKKVIIQLCIAVVLFVFLSFLGLKFLSIYSHHGDTVKVPDLVNLNEGELAKLINESGLRYEIIDSGAYNPKIKPGGVIEQLPLAHAQVKDGRKVYITLNPSSPGFVTLPKLKDVSVRRMVNHARATGFHIETLEYKKDIADFVILDVQMNGESLKQGQKIAKGSSVKLIVGKTDGKLCSLPYVVNFSKNDAVDKILSHGMNIGAIRIDDDAKDVEESELVVYKQTPMSARNEIYSAGRGVNLWLKKKEEKKEDE